MTSLPTARGINHDKWCKGVLVVRRWVITRSGEIVWNIIAENRVNLF